MKKIIAALLVIVLTCAFLASCNEDILDQIQDHKDEYNYQPVVVETIDVYMYVIVDDATEGAEQAVARQINAYTATKFNANMHITYLSKDEYETTVMNDLDIANIILVTSKDMMDTLMNDNRLYDLTSFYSTTTYGLLNVNIASALLEKSKINGALYTVPVNRVLGDYTMVCINKETVHKEMHYPLTAYSNLLSLDQVNTQENVDRLMRNIILDDLIKSKDVGDLKELCYNLVDLILENDETFTTKITTSLDESLKTIDGAKLLVNGLSEAARARLTTALSDADPIELLDSAVKADQTKVINALRPIYIEDCKDKDYLNSHSTSQTISEYILAREAKMIKLDENIENDLEPLFDAAEMNSINSCTNDTCKKIQKDEEFDFTTYAGCDVVLIDGCSYEDKAAFEEAGFVCNVVNTPIVTDEVAFTSAFAAVYHETDEEKHITAERLMQLIYAFDSDAYLHNLLQYGVEATNYKIENGNVVRHVGDNKYYMNPLYTGNIFNSYFCEELGHTTESAQYGKLQNKDAIAEVVVVPDAPTEE